jgi:hypothetical protein
MCSGSMQQRDQEKIATSNIDEAVAAANSSKAIGHSVTLLASSRGRFSCDRAGVLHGERNKHDDESREHEHPYVQTGSVARPARPLLRGSWGVGSDVGSSKLILQ